MKFKVGDRVLTPGLAAGTATYTDSETLVEDKSGWTYRQWFDAGYELRLSSSTVAKREDGIYTEEFHDDTRYDWGPGHLGMVPELSLHYLMERGQPAHEDIGPLPCSCTSRDLLICGCKCGGI